MSRSSSLAGRLSSRLLHFGTHRAVGMVGQELAGPLDLVGEGDVGQATRSGSNRRRTAARRRSRRGIQLVLERPGQSERLGAAGRLGILAKERVDRRQRGCRIVDGGQRQSLGLDGLPALVVPDLLLGGLDLSDRGGQLWRLVLELSEPGVQVGRRGPVGDLHAGRLDLPLGPFSVGPPGRGRPEQR